MTLKNLDKAPFPWFGGKSQAAPLVWQLLGDVPHYVEPFYGSGAVLLNRPHPCSRPYSSETVNDLDGFVVNFWRSVQFSPESTAVAASWPVSEADKTARQVALLRWRDGALDRLAGDAMWHDPIMAGWWAWAVSVQIGAFDGRQGWTADPVTGKLYRQPQGPTREPGVHRNRPHLTGNGQGVNHPDTREPGVYRNRPHLANNGMGVNHAGTREPGVLRDRPHLSGNGQGVNHAGTREPGVARDLPYLSADGRGVNRPGTREPGVYRDLPHLSNDGQGVNHAGTREPGVLDPPPSNASDLHRLDQDWGAAYHDLVMPELVRWFRHLAARLRHVRILNGSWERLVTTGASHTLPVRAGKGPVGVFLDPPYTNVRADGLYAADSFTVADDVREWCIANGDNPDKRIVLAGFDTEHTALEAAGWTVHEWFAAGYLTGGMANIGRTDSHDGHQQHRERLWASPHCLPLDVPDEQAALW